MLLDEDFTEAGGWGGGCEGLGGGGAPDPPLSCRRFDETLASSEW